MTQARFTPVARTEDIAPDTCHVVQASGIAILIVHSAGTFYAIENLCSHAEEPLDCGRIKRGWIACPAHGARFDLETGAPLGPPATAPIRTLALRIVEDVIEVAV